MRVATPARFQRGSMTLVRLFAAVACVCAAQVVGNAQSFTLTFAEALAQARERAPAVLIARARIDEARGRLAGARVRFRENPTIDAATGPRFTEAGTLNDVDLGISQIFETGGQRRARIAGAEAAISAETASAADAARIAVRDVALAFARAVHAQERVVLLSRAEDLASGIVTVAERRFAAGDIAVLDVNVARTARSRAQAARFAAAAARRAVIGELQQLLGLSAERSVVVDGTLQRPRGTDLQRLIATVDDRPDVRALQASIADAESDLRLGRGLRRPEVGLGVRMKREEGHRAVLGEVALTLPLFNRGQELQSVGAARASRLRVELDARRNAAIAELRTLYDVAVTRESALAAIEQESLAALDENDSQVAASTLDRSACRRCCSSDARSSRRGSSTSIGCLKRPKPPWRGTLPRGSCNDTSPGDRHHHCAGSRVRRLPQP
jgi:cobalt-zinc-cadmium efflux system outer membrane protein